MKPRVYLASAMTGVRDHQAWKSDLRADLDMYIEFLDPARCPEKLGYKGIFFRDKADLKSAQVVVAYFGPGDPVSFGLAAELGLANAYDIPVLACITNGYSHPFLLGMGNVLRTYSLTETRSVLGTLFNQEDLIW